MMAFNPFAAAQLPPGLAGTPIKAEDSTEALRFLAANSGLFGGAPMGLPPVDAVRAMLPGGLPFPLIYPSSLPPQEFKPELFSAGGGPMNPMLFEQFGFHPYGGLDGSRRKNATRETTAPLKEWLTQHRSNPYPTKGEKVMLAVMTKMTLTQKWLEQHMDHPYPGKGDKVRLAITANLTLTQVSTWFANARRRLKKENGGSMAIKRRPEDDDEDDMAELDRPSSSNSNESDKEDVDVDASETNENTKARDEMTPKKKILSIDDILDKTNGKKDEEVGSSKKDSPSSEESAPSMQFALQQQMLAMCRANPQLMAAMAPRPGFFPYHFMMNMAAMPQTPTGPPLNGSFTSETASVSPSSSHSPSAPAEESKSPLPTTEA